MDQPQCRLEELSRASWLEFLLGARELPLYMWALILTPLLALLVGGSFITLFICAPIPRPARKSEKTFVTVLKDGTTSRSQSLPNWYDDHIARKEAARKSGRSTAETHTVEPAEVFMSVVVPAYNEEKRLGIMLDEALDFLDKAYSATAKSSKSNGSLSNGTPDTAHLQGWEILIVSDGSKDRTSEVALDFARKHGLCEAILELGNGTTSEKLIQHKPSGSPTRTIRVITLEENRGKGGAVTHGMRHVRGAYAAFADADGASRFHDLGRLVEGCNKVRDSQGRAVGIGSRAHLVGSDEVVKRSFLRNALMHAFHLLLRFMTPPKTAAIADTQCGFKLFTRAALPYIIPYMHSEGWIFDVEMLMLAEMANIPMVEVSIGWKEVKGSKLNVIWDSLGMAWGLAILRAAWMTGVYERDF
ncbi:glycosyltransferase family 2 protein [Myriangium duriaei CBS 260.36]|uniref:dolichyl-phosphate beta-glucosyltransferase n=1 Tax=Myriangium duriaei CBS 260.36 TaxID=1168546 RepID=A0A9P4IXV1_9PEZI|nr:glycosyltransferase family 2 protein [Myriangium duriaei CBS 260.36]